MPVPTERIAAPARSLAALRTVTNVVSLMDALKRSLATEAANAAEQPQDKAKKPKKRAAGQREMLLPIAGKGTAKEKAKEPVRPVARQRKTG
jgi:DNA end-binding protein Ku